MVATGSVVTDVLASKLSTSLSSYMNATDGQAINITQAEWDSMYTVTGATSFGATNFAMTGTSVASSAGNVTQVARYNTVANGNQSKG